MNRTVALLLLLLVVTNGAWLIFSDRPSEPAEPRPDERSVREEEMAATITRLKEQLARYEPAETVPVAEPATPRSEPAARPRSGPTPEERKAQAERWAAANTQATKWAADLKQIEDPSIRARALDEIRAALSGTDEDAALPAFLALCRSWGVEYDRESVRPLVAPWLQHENSQTRAFAIQTLSATGAHRESLGLVLPLVSDPSPDVLKVLPGALLVMTEYRPDEATGRAIVRLLSHEDRQVRRAAISMMERVRTPTPDMEARLVELTTDEDPSTRRQSLFALGQLGTKSDRVVDVLLPHLDAADWNSRLVAYRGLTRGVPDSSKRKVADAVVRVAPKLPDHNNLMMCFRILNECGDETHVEAMRKLSTNPMLSDTLRSRLDRWLADLERRVR